MRPTEMRCSDGLRGEMRSNCEGRMMSNWLRQRTGEGHSGSDTITCLSRFSFYALCFLLHAMIRTGIAILPEWQGQRVCLNASVLLQVQSHVKCKVNIRNIYEAAEDFPIVVSRTIASGEGEETPGNGPCTARSHDGSWLSAWWFLEMSISSRWTRTTSNAVVASRKTVIRTSLVRTRVHHTSPCLVLFPLISPQHASPKHVQFLSARASKRDQYLCTTFCASSLPPSCK